METFLMVLCFSVLGVAVAAMAFGTATRPARNEAGVAAQPRAAEPAARFFVEPRRVRLPLPMEVGGRDEDVLVEERAPGQTVGWSALIPPYRFTLTATAPLETEVITLTRDALRGHFAARPAVGETVLLN